MLLPRVAVYLAGLSGVVVSLSACSSITPLAPSWCCVFACLPIYLSFPNSDASPNQQTLQHRSSSAPQALPRIQVRPRSLLSRSRQSCKHADTNSHSPSPRPSTSFSPTRPSLHLTPTCGMRHASWVVGCHQPRAHDICAYSQLRPIRNCRVKKTRRAFWGFRLRVWYGIYSIYSIYYDI